MAARTIPEALILASQILKKHRIDSASLMCISIGKFGGLMIEVEAPKLLEIIDALRIPTESIKLRWTSDGELSLRFKNADVGYSATFSQQLQQQLAGKINRLVGRPLCGVKS